MTDFDFRRTATAVLGALLLSATSIFAAVGPARAAAPSNGVAASSNMASHAVGKAM